MLIGLHDAEKDSMPNKTYPNYALMKISAWHKAQGDTVKWWLPLNNGGYDFVYSSKIFDFTPENPYLPPDAVKGGTGYCVKSKLPPEIDMAFPDYSIYPSCDYAIGFITRGCPNACHWCVVPEKEGGIAAYRDWREVVRSDTDKLVLMDNNILACNYGIQQLKSLIGSGYKIDLNQGMDARLVTPEIADIIARLKWIKYIRFACDTMSQVPYIERVYKLLTARGVAPGRVYIYFLVTADLGEAERRINALSRLKSITIKTQAERNPRQGLEPNAAQKKFATEYGYRQLWRRETWTDYCNRLGFFY